MTESLSPVKPSGKKSLPVNLSLILLITATALTFKTSLGSPWMPWAANTCSLVTSLLGKEAAAPSIMSSISCTGALSTGSPFSFLQKKKFSK